MINWRLLIRGVFQMMVANVKQPMGQNIVKCYADAVGCKIENAIECFRVTAVIIVWSEVDQGPKVGKRRKFSPVASSSRG
jgi:hypothetical protein